MELKLPGTYSFRKNHLHLNNLKWLVSKTVGDITLFVLLWHWLRKIIPGNYLIFIKLTLN